MKLNEIRIRDPYILPYEGAYYMYGSRMRYSNQEEQLGFDVYKSNDLQNWSEPKSVLENTGYFADKTDFWAPEVHVYEGKIYMFASCKGRNSEHRGTYVLTSDKPDGKFEIHSNGAITPKDWECLDGTLYIENGKPYMVFCREWTQIGNGEICAIEMSTDLREAVGDPFLLFKASEATWTKRFHDGDYVTDGPFLFKEDDVLYMLWSSYGVDGYVESIAYAECGNLFGEWKQTNKLHCNDDGGHGMMFEDFNNQRKIILHSPNSKSGTHPKIYNLIKLCKGDYEFEEIGELL